MSLFHLLQNDLNSLDNPEKLKKSKKSLIEPLEKFRQESND